VCFTSLDTGDWLRAGDKVIGEGESERHSKGEFGGGGNIAEWRLLEDKSAMAFVAVLTVALEAATKDAVKSVGFNEVQ
jgi:hypothetical protein